ncbi:putative Two-component response regulator-like PRR73 [Cocos nucifera]|uniref:Putative Two-component response regulator-like PRR73 n=1 Tax=Cocos nucifera TaxID=13894 RepID=A0A8K0I7Q0_COCNU|nr:putative Two-component response regulator-like PRR73 [Cocos nucifera]
MGRVDQVSPNGAGNKGIAESNHHIQDEHKEVRDGIVREGQGLSREDESRINEAAKDLHNDQEGYGAVPAAHQSGPQKQQQIPGPIIRWERFLPVRSLKVLLVENDDSTRQVVSALLRNCNYEVLTVVLFMLYAMFSISKGLTGVSGLYLALPLLALDLMHLHSTLVPFDLEEFRIVVEVEGLTPCLVRILRGMMGMGLEGWMAFIYRLVQKITGRMDEKVGFSIYLGPPICILPNWEDVRRMDGSLMVTAVANGLQAWKILEDLTNHIDLVLTEVVMPCLSGIGLLSKIMSHKTCKNIPVIMMSSNDSMGTVFKCLSKGAVDFLVKPIRKNELKNLWQHVWRRCQSSSGSGSESGIQIQKSARSKSTDDSDNNSGSNDDDDDGSIGLNIRDGSDNGSGTQSSWTKRAVDVDSPQPMPPSDQLADPPDSTCALVIHPKPETFCNDLVPMTANRECKGQKELADDFMGKDLEIGVARNPDAQHESYPTEQVSTKLTGTSMDKLPESDPKNEGILGLDDNNMSDEPSTQAADPIGAITNSMDAQLVTRVMEAPNGFSKITEGKDTTLDGSMELPSLELSLKRLRSTGRDGTATHYHHNVLRRSDLSAFSRYHTSATSNQAPTGHGGSCSPLNNSSEAVKTESTNNMISNSNAAPLKRVSGGSSNNNDMGSTTNNVFTKPVAYKEKAASTSAVKCIQPFSAFHPVQQVMQQKVVDLTAASIGPPREIQHQVQVHHRHHHYHHHHHHIHSMQLQPPDHDDMSLKDMATAGPQCGSSTMFTGPVEGIAANFSVNGSNSGSHHGSNVQNGSSTAVNAVGMNMEIVNGIADKSAAGGSGSGVDQNRFAWREAALKKFRQKRKERNFGKKVDNFWWHVYIQYFISRGMSIAFTKYS